MAAITISFEVDSDRLGSYADEHLAQLWHIGQANPALWTHQASHVAAKTEWRA